MFILLLVYNNYDDLTTLKIKRNSININLLDFAINSFLRARERLRCDRAYNTIQYNIRLWLDRMLAQQYG